MLKKRILAALLAAALAVALLPTALAGDLDAEPVDTIPYDDTAVPEVTVTSPGAPDAASDGLTDLTPAGMTLGTGSHIAYVSGTDGYFRPQGNVTRAEVAAILYRLLPQPAPDFASYADVPAESWYAQAAGAMGALGVLRPGEAEFLPGQEMTRGEFIRAVACFFPAAPAGEPFADVSPLDPNADAYLTARSWGWLSGFEDGTLRPEQKLTRAEAVVMLNRALSRRPDQEYIDGQCSLVYLDVSADSWYYYDVMEASVAHEHRMDLDGERWTSHTPVKLEMTPGFHLIDNWLYCYSEEKDELLRSTTVNGFTFDASGRYTTGDADLDARLHEIVSEQTNAGMTQEQKLRALYVYTRDSFTYLRRPAYDFGAKGFMQKDASDMLKNGYGNCYSYASLFWYLSRWIGYESQIYSGTVGSNKRPHSWVEINFDGRDYIFDTELEMAYHKKNRYDINLYKYIDVDGWIYIKPSSPSNE